MANECQRGILRLMDLIAFKQSLEGRAPPAGLNPALEALWHQARGDWDRAHQLARTHPGADGAWVHAYLHRVEGGNRNASYWYGRAGKSYSEAPAEKEWEEIATTLLTSS